MTLQQLNFMFWVSGAISIFDGICLTVSSAVPELRDLSGLFLVCTLLTFFGAITYYLRARELEKKNLDREK